MWCWFGRRGQGYTLELLNSGAVGGHEPTALRFAGEVWRGLAFGWSDLDTVR